MKSGIDIEIIGAKTSRQTLKAYVKNNFTN